MKAAYDGQLLDIAEAGGVQIEVDKSGERIWIHVDGVTVLRLQGVYPGSTTLNGEFYSPK
jgi:hypothetical protein